MTISERLFAIMKEKNISMPELSRMTGISRFTIYDWQRRATNPGADKIMIICESLGITPEELLVGTPAERENSFDAGSENELDKQIISDVQKLSADQKKRLLAYMSMLMNTKE